MTTHTQTEVHRDIRLDRCVGRDGIETVRNRDRQSPENFEFSREGLGAIARL